jgi:hypothetical protein
MSTYNINHPMADEMSVQDSPFHYCSPGMSSEIAFFKKGDWVVIPLPDFAEYHDGSDPGRNDTAVYGWVPNDLIDSFLAKYVI